jgi:hypothetical protein
MRNFGSENLQNSYSQNPRRNQARYQYEERLIDSARILDWISKQVENPWPVPTTSQSQAAAVSDVVALKVGEYYREVGLRAPTIANQPAIVRLVQQINAGLQLLNIPSVTDSLPTESNLNEATVAVATAYAFTREIDAAFNIGLMLTPKLDEWCSSFESLLLNITR